MVVFLSRNYSILVSQASVPDSTCGFMWLFRLVSTRNPIFLPKRVWRSVNTIICRLSQGSRLLLPHFWQRYVELTEHSCSNQRKTQKLQKIAISAKNICSLRSKAIIGWRYIAKQSHWTAPTIPHKKGANSKLFANHDPSERHFWSRGRPSPRTHQLQTCGLGHLHRQYLHSLSIENCPSRTSPRQTGNNKPQPFISPLCRSGGVWLSFHPRPSCMAQKVGNSCMYLLNTRSDVLRSQLPAKFIPADG